MTSLKTDLKQNEVVVVFMHFCNHGNTNILFSRYLQIMLESSFEFENMAYKIVLQYGFYLEKWKIIQ